MRVVGSIKPDIEIADNIDRFLVGGNLIENDGQFIKQRLLYGS